MIHLLLDISLLSFRRIVCWIWHRGSGCRGFMGPVPPPLFIRALHYSVEFFQDPVDRIDPPRRHVLIPVRLQRIIKELSRILKGLMGIPQHVLRHLGVRACFSSDLSSRSNDRTNAGSSFVPTPQDQSYQDNPDPPIAAHIEDCFPAVQVGPNSRWARGGSGTGGETACRSG